MAPNPTTCDNADKNESALSPGWWGTGLLVQREKDKRHVVLDAARGVIFFRRNEVMGEVLAWLDMVNGGRWQVKLFAHSAHFKELLAH